MTDDGVLALLAQARSDGAAARDPVGFAVIEALAQRAASQHGPTRAVLLQRVQQRLAALPAAEASCAHGADTPAPLAALSELVDRLGRMRARTAPRSPHAATARPVPLKAVAAFKSTWSRLRADQRLRQAMAQVPTMAGPLNSSSLVNRMLQTMREVSPEYLDAFMAHIDTLLWLEQASGGALPTRPQRK